MTQQTEDPPDALTVLGNETRVAIPRELADAENALSFTDLRERVGIRDTGKFNYNLTKLCSCFVRETEGGYELGHAGTRVIDATTPRDDSASGDDPEAIDESDTCPVCGAKDCEKLFHVHLTPPWG